MIQKNEVALILLISGHELIGKVENFTADKIELDKPLAVVYEMQQPGKIGFGFAPFLPMVKGDVRDFDRSHVITIAEPNTHLEEAYKRATGAIAVPSRTLLLEGSPKP